MFDDDKNQSGFLETMLAFNIGWHMFDDDNQIEKQDNNSGDELSLIIFIFLLVALFSSNKILFTAGILVLSYVLTRNIKNCLCLFVSFFIAGWITYCVDVTGTLLVLFLIPTVIVVYRVIKNCVNILCKYKK